MVLAKQSRLSVSPVTREQFERLLKLAGTKIWRTIETGGNENLANNFQIAFWFLNWANVHAVVRLYPKLGGNTIKLLIASVERIWRKCVSTRSTWRKYVELSPDR